MVALDFSKAKQHALLKAHGFDGSAFVGRYGDNALHPPA
jgi:hypothetical protein